MIWYEWVCEETNGDGDISDSNHADTLKGVMVFYEEGNEIALIKSSSQYPHREYVYLNGGILPEEFDDDHRVPNRFHKEAEKERR